MDTTDRGAELEVVLAQVARLEAAVGARDRFIAAIGHELRNAVSPLVMLAESVHVSTDILPTERRAQMLKRNLSRLIATLDRVSDVAQLRGEKLVLAPEPVALRAVMAELFAELAPDAAAANMELQLDAPADVTGTWDRARLRQIAFHLLTNAIRHSGGSQVVASIAGDESHAVLTVSDNGRGIPADRRAHLFDAFDVAGPNRSGGLGVGLWIVQTLCFRFHGTVALVEDHAPGACVRVVLPRV